MHYYLAKLDKTQYICLKNDSQLKALLELNDEIADHVYVAHVDGILRYGFFLFIFFFVHMPYILGLGIIFLIVIIYVVILLKFQYLKHTKSQSI